MPVAQKRPEATETDPGRLPGSTVWVNNLGPIAGGRITLEHLTVLIGPNNSGKFYTAPVRPSFVESLRVCNTAKRLADDAHRISDHGAQTTLERPRCSFPEVDSALERPASGIPDTGAETRGELPADIPAGSGRTVLSEVYPDIFTDKMKDGMRPTQSVCAAVGSKSRARNVPLGQHVVEQSC